MPTTREQRFSNPTETRAHCIGAEPEAINDSQRPKFLPVNIIRNSILGSGTFGDVYKAVYKRWQTEVAVKVIDKTKGKLGEIEVNEVERLRHPNVLRVYEAFDNNEEMLIITDICGQSLARLIEEQQRADRFFGVDDILNWCGQMCQGIEYLHAFRIFHGDIKPGNVLIQHIKHNNEDITIVKLCDFGLSRIYGTNPTKATVTGTWNYMAPEMFLQEDQDKNDRSRIDIWAYGISCFCIATLAEPFMPDTKDIRGMKELFSRGITEPVDVEWPDPNFKEQVLKKILKFQPDERPSASRILSYLQGSGFSTNYSQQTGRNDPIYDELKKLEAKDERIESLQKKNESHEEAHTTFFNYLETSKRNGYGEEVKRLGSTDPEIYNDNLIYSAEQVLEKFKACYSRLQTGNH